MDIYTVSFFGHRQIINSQHIEKILAQIIKKLIVNKEFVEFLVGRNGDFDILTASVIKQMIKKYAYHNASLTLVLPYMRAEFRDNEQSFLNYYDTVEICSESEKAHFKSAIQIRNKSMVDRSDVVICYVEHQQGGAYTTMQYAYKQKKKVLNIATHFDSVEQ